LVFLASKKCEWCGELFEVKSLFSNDKYCNEHKKEAHKENVRKARNVHYMAYKKVSILSQLGTTTMSKHPDPDFEEEHKLIQKEIKRNKGITTVYKGKRTYNKGFTIFTQFPKINDTHLGTLITHNYATFTDYSNQHTQNLFNQHITRCLECKSNFIEKDNKHATVNCVDCGLVLLGPPIDGITYPMRIYPMNDNLAPIFDERYEPLPKTKKETRRDMVNVLCRTCYNPYTIQLKDKEAFRCDCGSKVMGSGICLPHEGDGFSEEGYETRYDTRLTEDRGIGQ
jgi:DNA-directed RNA polymerase subunit RPC12/RpoP